MDNKASRSSLQGNKRSTSEKIKKLRSSEEGRVEDQKKWRKVSKDEDVDRVRKG
jgi:hypothetical protein